MRIVIANNNPVHLQVEQYCQAKFNLTIFNEKSELSLEALEQIQPDFVFFLHWSYVIPKEIHERFNCIVFHMTDLPFGRGGSPLQNLIVRGFEETIISAIKVTEGIDAGPIILKKRLYLGGSAEEIFIRAGKRIIEMIGVIVREKPQPVPQEGEVTIFKRRKPEESNLQSVNEKEKIYDFIRMLDAENYPKAFIETEFFKFEFTRASLKSDCVIAEVKITKKPDYV